MSTHKIPVDVGALVAGKYRVEGVLASGGMGVVLAAVHVDLGHKVAIKVLRPEAASDAQAVGRFQREARAAARVQSEHVARIQDVGRLDDGTPYMVMEYLEGRDLASVVSLRKRIGVTEAVDWLLEACEAVAAAHAAGVVHRDLKPSNLFLARRPDGSQTIKVVDFGISKLMQTAASSEEQLSLTRDFETLGSPIYMSPEQMLSARDVDARTDIWSLGVILFKLITGVPPFNAASVPEVCAMIIREPPQRPRELLPDLPETLEASLLRCLEKDPAARFASVAEFAAEIAPHASPAARGILAHIAKLGGPREAVRDADDDEAAAQEWHAADGDYATMSATATVMRDDVRSILSKPPRPRRRWLAGSLAAVPVIAVGAWMLARPTPAPPTLVPSALVSAAENRRVVGPLTAPLSPPPAASAPASPASVEAAPGAKRPRGSAVRSPAAAAASAPAVTPPPTSPPPAAPAPSPRAGDDNPLHL